MRPPGEDSSTPEPVAPSHNRGAAEPVRAPGSRTADDVRVLPVRMAAVVVEQLDEARRRLGLASRAELFRRALHGYLVEPGRRGGGAHTLDRF